MDHKFHITNKRLDSLARWGITIGGCAVIASVLAILLQIVSVTLPLFGSASSEVVGRVSLPKAGEIMLLGLDDSLENGFSLSRQGNVSFFSLKATSNLKAGSQGSPVPLARPEGATKLIDASSDIPGQLSLLWDNGKAAIVRVSFDREEKIVTPRMEELFQDGPSGDGQPTVKVVGRALDQDGFRMVRLLADQRFSVSMVAVKKNVLGEEKQTRHNYMLTPVTTEKISAFVLDLKGERLYAGTESGTIIAWQLDDQNGRLLETTPAFRDRGITALAMVYGSESLAVGDNRGGLTVWSWVRSDPGSQVRKLRQLHTLHGHADPVIAIVPGTAGRSLLSLDSRGEIHVDHATSERNLLTFKAQPSTTIMALSVRDKGLAILNSDGTVTAWRIAMPYAEISLKTLFGKVWYEGYDEPAYVWQSSSANDDFEPKLSITPLIFGTLKGTFYAMLLAIPLALFGALYVSQFATPGLRRIIKPVVEVMASVPSVVIGFLVALWFAPLVEKNILGLLLFLIITPGCFVLFMSLWGLAEQRGLLRNFPQGQEYLLLMPLLLLVAVAAWQLGPLVEKAMFGDFKLWLFGETGMRYDQRNCIIIAFGLGFCVIPIIFSIAEDSLSNIPASLSAAALALGASRWQTAWRVILPSASPGIFAAIMIGFGRAVGETMIVLMATGNTPIMDWSFLNGMRTLSANIAVEIPEAPFKGPLYRVLFLCAVLLFLLTFVLNTGAELIRQHLQKKYGRY